MLAGENSLRHEISKLALLNFHTAKRKEKEKHKLHVNVHHESFCFTFPNQSTLRSGTTKQLTK